MQEEKVNRFISKFLENKLSDQEAQLLLAWVEESEDHLNYFYEIAEIEYLLNSISPIEYQPSLNALRKAVSKEKTKKRRTTFLKIAAVFIGIIGIGLWFYGSYHSTDSKPLVNEEFINQNNIIQPGTNKATVILGNGKRVSLSGDKKSKNAYFQSNGKEIAYHSDSVENTTKNGDLVYNELDIPKGGIFTLRLADSTKVWLNSDSRLRYPVHFRKGQPREVELIRGEAYFAVSPSEQHHGDHFKVKSGAMEIEVTGTQFNLKAYKDESKIYTTLVEGRVILCSANKKVILHPGDRATLTAGSGNIEIQHHANLEALSWRNGIFSFKDKSLKEIMRVLSRWYNMEVHFQSPEIAQEHFTGVIGKNQSIEEILSILGKTNNIKYSMKDRNLTIK